MAKIAKIKPRVLASPDSLALLLVLMTGLWALYSMGTAPQYYEPTPSALAVIGIPAKLGNTVVIGGISLNEQIGVDVPSLTSLHLKGLSDGYASTLDRTTKYRQTLRLAKSGSDGFTGGTIQYTRDSYGNSGDFLVFPYASPAFEYEILFDQGLEGTIEGTEVPSLAETSLDFMGGPANIFKATVIGDSVTLRFWGAGGDFELRDSDITDNSFERSVKVAGRTINSQVKISGSVSGDSIRIYSITYRFLAYSLAGGDNYIPPKRGIRQFLREPEGLLNPSFDIIYGGILGGLTASAVEPSYSSSRGGNLFFDPSGGDRYNLIFTNVVGQTFKVPYVALVSGSPALGNSKQSLVVREGSSSADFNIDPGDYFIVTSSNDIGGVTNVVVYSGLSMSSDELYFDFLGGGSQTVVFDPSTGRGVLNVKGANYDVYVDLAGSERIVVDQNHDGSISGSSVSLVLQTGAMINPGATSTTVRIPRRLFDNPPSADETVTINFFANGNNIDLRVPDQSSITMHQGSDRLLKGMTTYGVQYTVDDYRAPSTLAIDIPGGQARPVVAATSGVGRVSKSGQTGGFVVVTLERERFLPSSSGAVSSRSGVGIND